MFKNKNTTIILVSVLITAVVVIFYKLSDNDSINWYIGGALVLGASLAFYWGYKLLMSYLGKGNITKQVYAKLHNLDHPVVQGDVDFYFELPEEDNISFDLLDEHDNVLINFAKTTLKKGNHRYPFNTLEYSNGVYFYQLKTKNQTSTKKFIINN